MDTNKLWMYAVLKLGRNSRGMVDLGLKKTLASDYLSFFGWVGRKFILFYFSFYFFVGKMGSKEFILFYLKKYIAMMTTQ